MAFIYRDYVGPLMNNFIGNTALYNRTTRVWAKEDEFNYSWRLLWYNRGTFRQDEAFLGWINKLGISMEALKSENYKDIETVWFWFNPAKTPHEDFNSIYEFMTDLELSDNLDSKLNVGDKINVMTTYSGETMYILDGHSEPWFPDGEGNSRTITGPGMDTQYVRDTILGDRWRYYANILEGDLERSTLPIVNYDGYDQESSGKIPVTTLPPTTPVCTTYMEKVDGSIITGNEDNLKFFSLAMLDEYQSCFEITKNEDGTPKLIDLGISSYTKDVPIDETRPVFDENGILIIYPAEDIYANPIGAVSRYTFGFEYTYTGSGENDYLIGDIQTYMPAMFPKDAENSNNIQNTLQKIAIAELYAPEIETIEDTTRPGIYIPIIGTGGWYPYFDKIGDKWYLNIDRVSTMKKYEFVNMMSDCLDTGYDIEDPSIWERLFAGFLVIVAVVIAIFVPYLLVPAIKGLAAISLGLGLFSITITIGTMILSQMGLSAYSLVRVLGQVAQITGLVATVTGIMASVQAVFNRLAVEAGKVGTYTVGEFVMDFSKQMIDNVINSVTSGIEGVFNLLTDSKNVLMGTGKSLADTTKLGWFSRLSNGIKMYNNFFERSNDTVTSTNQEQMEKRDFQHPEQMYSISEQMIYEPDALDKLSVLKEQQLGGTKTEELMQRIA